MEKLFKLKGFIPFIIILFLNAFVDLGHKILIQNTIFKIYDGQTQIILTTIVNGLILLPFVLLFSPAGFISDKYKKPQVMKISAAAAILLTILITLSYYQGWFELAFGMTFLLAIQSAIYSPAKYGYIKELIGIDRLATANAAVQAITIVAILSGIFAFSVLFESLLSDVSFKSESDILKTIAPTGFILIIGSIIEFIMTFRLPLTEHNTSHVNFNLKLYSTGQYLKNNLNKISGNRTIWLSIIGLSVFWGISQVMLAAFPAFVKETFSETSTIIIQGILASSGVGIIIGSILAGRASKHHIETGLVPIGAMGVVITLFFIPQLNSLTFLAVDSLLFGIFGGLFIVPLNTLIQFHAKDEELGTILAGNNWIQNTVMSGFLGLTVFFAINKIDSVGLFHLLTMTAFIGALYTIYHLPQSLVRYLIGRLFSSQYRIKVQGLENLPGQGGVLMLGNHISWLDWAMIQIASPRPVRFVMHKAIYQKWYLKRFLDLFGVISISGGSSKETLNNINKLLKDGEVVCLFPEGSISRSGQLGEFKRGYEKTVEGVNGIILPFYLHGLWGSRFSRSSENLQQIRNNKEVIVAFGKPLPMDTPVYELKRHVFDLSVDTWEKHSKQLEPIPLAWMRMAKRRGSKINLADAQGNSSLNGYKTLTGVIAFSRLIAQHSPEQNIGLLLPTSSAGIITNMAVLLQGKTLVNLNYTASNQALLSAINKADIKSLYTSKRFIKKLKQKGIEPGELLDQVEVYYLEELKDKISRISKLSILLASILLPARWLYELYGKTVNIEQPAAILFSSGSEGEPKGVVLSHRNLMVNIKQVSDVLDTRQEDVVMATLPLFHAFGLTVTSLMPMVEGMPAICHPDPTDALTIAKAISRYEATIFCGTSTFLRLFIRNRRIPALMLDSLRIVVAGAERLNPQIREAFKLKFNKDIYEGYGTTETSPVASVNIPDRMDPKDWQVQSGHQLGTVGLPIPGGSFRIVDPETMHTLPVDEDGLILFSGAQVMLGYLNDAHKTSEVIIELDGKRWYKTGDKGHLNKDGFLTIVDRYSRFAKIGGEMISLGAIENTIGELLIDDIEILATAIPDGKKGESVTLLFAGEIDEGELKALINESGLNPLMRPATLIKVESIPKLGSGKNNFSQAKNIAIQATE